MPERMPKPSTFPAPNRFQYAPNFIGTYQHLFVTFSVQLIFSILDHNHISNASNSFILTLVNFRVSVAYSATFQTVLFIIHFFCSQFNFPVNSFLVREQCLPIAILAHMSFVLYSYFFTGTSLRYVRVFAVAIPSVVCLSSVCLSSVMLVHFT